MRINIVRAVFVVFGALVINAQTTLTFEELGSVLYSPVASGAPHLPYSAVEVIRHVRRVSGADTVNETTRRVFRDLQGRMRREIPLAMGATRPPIVSGDHRFRRKVRLLLRALESDSASLATGVRAHHDSSADRQDCRYGWRDHRTVESATDDGRSAEGVKWTTKSSAPGDKIGIVSYRIGADVLHRR